VGQTARKTDLDRKIALFGMPVQAAFFHVFKSWCLKGSIYFNNFAIEIKEF
jgi:hypothetical protein